ncbi:MAG: bifunctional oligoribonuclease/PAP phosphatase NrnA [Lachnospiraceae bacterium]|nr:bifunctional oligoribonuclease/PAP phosphatase NrnA [Lachnospiraceae bacterium]
MDRIHEELTKAKTVAIAGHIKPDGDCMGSCLGLYNYILKKYPDVEVDVFAEAIPPAFEFMKGTDKLILNYEGRERYDLFFSLDCGDLDRLGKADKHFKRAGRTICIDHHISNKGFADINYIRPEISSTSEYVYELIDTSYVDIPIAECLYVGIVHDTGVFQYSCTSSRTMAVAGELMDKGIDYPRLVDESYYEKHMVQNRLMGYCLLNCQLKLDDKVVMALLPKSVLDEYGGVASDLEGIVAVLRHTKGIEVAVFIYELNEGRYKVSLRSSGKVDVSVISVEFGGGGHKMAAGYSVKCDIHKATEKLLSMIEEQLRGQD